MRIELTIDPAATPTTMRGLWEKRLEILAAADVIGAQHYQEKDLEKRTNPLFERVCELEVMAADIEIKTLDDLIAAFDIYDGMKCGMDTDYSDRRDANLIDAMRRAVVHFAGRKEAFGSIDLRPATTKADASGSISPVEIADALNEVRHSLALALELAESRAHRTQSDLERAAVNGLVDLLYQQIDRLEALRDRVHPEA